MSIIKIPEPWKSFLSEINSRLNKETWLHCLGGFVVTTLWGAPRVTSDIDALTIGPRSEHKLILDMAGKGAELHRRYNLYIDHVAVATYPERYDERLTEMFPGAFDRLRLLALDPYDIALTKLERNSPRDRDDIKYLARTVPFDLDLLVNRYKSELRPYLSNEERHDRTLKLWAEAIKEERSRGYGLSM